MQKSIWLSKTKLKQNKQCEKMLWLELNKRDVGVWEDSEQMIFLQGRDVEQIARDFFPDGVLMDKFANEEKIKETQKLLKKHTVVFEASFAAKQTIIQFDMLIKNDDGSFNAIEVKSSGSFKPDYLEDVTIQYWIADLAGIKIKNYQLWYVNKKATSIDVKDFFIKEDVTEKAINNKPSFDQLLQNAQETSLLKEEPKKTIGSHCSNPYSCKFWKYCSEKVNQKNDSVLTLPYFPNKYKSLALGIDSVNHPEFDKVYKYSEQNPLIVSSIRENVLKLDQEKINQTISTWKYPLNFFDFETLMLAIPVLKNQLPYQQLVFQHSTHVLNQEGSIQHYEFLHESLDCPSEDVIKSMLIALDNQGSIVSYNKSFEMSRIKELAVVHSQYKVQLLALLDRFVDLMDVVKEYVYHPEFKGSYSLKVVSPTLLKEYGSYSDSLIKSGSEISKYYVEFLQTNDLTRKQQIKEALLKYCKYDTTNLILLMKWLLDQSVDLKTLVNNSVNDVSTITNKVA